MDRPNGGADRPWNPVWMFLIALLLSPLAAAGPHAFNFHRLGQPSLVRSQIITNILLGGLLFLLAIRASVLLTASPGSRHVHLFLALVVAVYFYRSQSRLYDRAIATGSATGKWWQPVGLGLCTSLILLIVSYGVETLYMANFQQALVALEKEEYEVAEKIFRHYKEVNPNMSEARYNLAVVYANTGRLALAKEELRDALKVSPQDQSVRQFLSQLERGEGEPVDEAGPSSANASDGRSS